MRAPIPDTVGDATADAADPHGFVLTSLSQLPDRATPGYAVALLAERDLHLHVI